MSYLYVFLLSIFISIFISFSVYFLFKKYKILDNPKKYNINRKPVPYPIGICFFLSFFIIICILFGISNLDSKHIGIIVALGLLTIFNFIDDRKSIKVFYRLIMQICICFILIYSNIKIDFINIPFIGTVYLDNFTIYNIPIIIYIASIIWFMFFMNAINWFDGISGLVNSVSIASFLVLLLLVYVLSLNINISIKELNNLNHIGILSVIGLGITIILLFFDFPYKIPKALLGDSGSMSIGLFIGILSILSGSKMATTFIVLAIPLIDSILVILHRIQNKKNPFKGDYNHFHHDLLKSGYKKSYIIILFSLISFILGVLAIYLNSIGKLIMIVIIFISIYKIKFSIAKKR